MIINIAKRAPFIAFACLLGMGCGSSAITGDDARSQATQLVAGEVLSVSAGFGADKLLWDVKVRAANQAVLTVSFFEPDGALYGIDDEAGPFDYELPRPQADFLTYVEARAKAMTSKTGALVDWNLRYAPDGYRYEYYVRDSAEQLWEIKLGAISGAITSVEAKDAVD